VFVVYTMQILIRGHEAHDLESVADCRRKRDDGKGILAELNSQERLVALPGIEPGFED
jgi:hypothetical protein